MDTTPQFEEGTTLDRFLMETLRGHSGATGTFVDLVQSIALAGKLISSRVNRAGPRRHDRRHRRGQHPG